MNATDPTGLSSRTPGRYRLGLRDLRSDPYGREILGHYLYGRGEPLVINDNPLWSDYMMDNRMLRQSTADYMRRQAAGLRKGAVVAFDRRKNAEVDNGEGIIGYNYLHGTDKNVGDFHISGYISKHRDGEAAFVMRYQWNDVINPNLMYESDSYKVKISVGLQGLSQNVNPTDYTIRISWSDRSVMNSAGRYTTGWLSGR